MASSFYQNYRAKQTKNLARIGNKMQKLNGHFGARKDKFGRTGGHLKKGTRQKDGGLGRPRRTAYDQPSITAAASCLRPLLFSVFDQATLCKGLRRLPADKQRLPFASQSRKAFPLFRWPFPHLARPFFAIKTFLAMTVKFLHACFWPSALFCGHGWPKCSIAS